MSFRGYNGRGRGRGRGQYHHQRGRGRGRGRGRSHYNNQPKNVNQTGEGLKSLLVSLENASYGAYKSLQGIAWKFGNKFTLFFDRIQSDPFAPASNIRVRLNQKIAQIPPSFYQNKIRNIACCDYLTRSFAEICKKYDYDRRATGPWSAKKGGDLLINCPKQHVVERNSCFINSEFIEVRFDCALPGRGRKICGQWCAEVICNNLPFVIDKSLIFKNLNASHFKHHIDCIEDQQYLRQEILPKLGLIAFIPNNAMLARRSGVCDKALTEKEGAVPFVYSDNDALQIKDIKLLNNKSLKLCGLGIRKGVTLIIGGGFHGKSTLMNALEVGVYNHIPGDGREYVVCVENAVKIRSEDKRLINNVNITPFINNLPQKKSCSEFTTMNASGSTSMSANIMEAIEMKTECLLIDEDTSATNFMIRDEHMHKLVEKGIVNEPITPFISKINALYKQLNVSSILVIGGAGSYFEVAQNVILMKEYLPKNVTKIAKKLTAKSMIKIEAEFGKISTRKLRFDSFENGKNKNRKIKIDGKGQTILYGDDLIDLGFESQIIESGQLETISRMIEYVKQNVVAHSNEAMSLYEIMLRIDKDLDKDYEEMGMDILNRVKNMRYSNICCNKMVRPRIQEMSAALNRLKGLKMYSQ